MDDFKKEYKKQKEDDERKEPVDPDIVKLQKNPCKHILGMKRSQAIGPIQAVRDGHTPCLKYLRMCGAPFSQRVVDEAIKYRRIDCIH